MSELNSYIVSMGFRDAWDLIGVVAGIVFICVFVFKPKE
jgi:hypothetical protein